jgi:hypothetical protein
MRNLIVSAAAAAALLGIAAPASSQSIRIEVVGEPERRGPSEAYFLPSAGNPVAFQCAKNVCTQSIPPQPQDWRVRIRYQQGPQPLAMSVVVRPGPGVDRIVLQIPEPSQRTSCHFKDAEDLAEAVDDPRDAFRQLVQISHLLKNQQEPCAQAVRRDLMRIRERNITFLRSALPYFRTIS